MDDGYTRQNDISFDASLTRIRIYILVRHIYMWYIRSTPYIHHYSNQFFFPHTYFSSYTFSTSPVLVVVNVAVSGISSPDRPSMSGSLTRGRWYIPTYMTYTPPTQFERDHRAHKTLTAAVYKGTYIDQCWYSILIILYSPLSIIYTVLHIK